ncbi:MAG TPA: hypothetical protein VJ824_00020 [Bacillota bacterium]|nr:hypothetical protein [Bacillota bacterium]
MTRIGSLQVRTLFLISAGLIVASLFFPWWNLELIAPQYREGLNITVYPSKLAGQIDIINILNHYIGMADIREDSFTELKYIPYILGFIAILLVINAILLSKFLTKSIVVISTLAGATGLYDMYRWLHVFGTNLSPQAPIKVPPFVPPMLGSNQLANFQTYSSFCIGFYFVIFAILIVYVAAWLICKRS